MITEYYRNYIEIVEAGNISAAARKCLIAQPALSNQLKVLEEFYGTRLLIRGARKVEMTPTGRIVYEKAKMICKLEEQAQIEVNQQKEGITGTLTMALPPTNNRVFLEKILKSFMEKYPDIKVELYEFATDKVMEYVKNGIADIGFVRAPLTMPEEIEYYPVKSETLQLVMTKTNRLAKKEILSIEDLDQEEIVISRSWKNTIEKLQEMKNIKIEIAAVTTSRQVAIEIAEIRNSMALVPTGTGDHVSENLICKKIADLDFQVNRGFIIKKNMEKSKLLEHFFELLQISI